MKIENMDCVVFLRGLPGGCAETAAQRLVKLYDCSEIKRDREDEDLPYWRFK